MSIIEENKIDLIGDNLNSNSLCLGISDHLGWEDIESHVQILQKKINAYLEYIEGGQLIQDRPDAINRPIVIEVIGKHEVPNPVIEKYFNKIKKILKQAGYEFTYYKLESQKNYKGPI